MKSLPRSAVIALLIVITCVGLGLRVAQSLRISSFVHADEVFQTLEPAHRLIYGSGIVTWEWRDGVRSWVFPWLLSLVMRCTEWMGPGSTGYLLAIRLLLALTSMTTVWFGYAWAKRASGTEAAILAAAGCALWYGLVGFAPRAFSEVMATNFLLVALYVGYYAAWPTEKGRLLLAGFFFGLTMSFRVPLAPTVLFAAFFCCRKDWKQLLPLACGAALPVLAFGLADLVTWHHAFQSFYLYVQENLSGRSQSFGTEPWNWYLVDLTKHFGPVLLLAVLGVRRCKFLGGVGLIILVSHSLIAHKEPRFIYPMAPILIVLAAIGLWEILGRAAATLKIAVNPVTMILTGAAILLSCSSLLGSAFPYSRDSQTMAYFHQLSEEKDVCGVALYGVPWVLSGGYTYLHHPVAIIVPGSEQFNAEAENFNVLVARQGFPITDSRYVPRDCRHGICLYQRPGGCTHSSTVELNTLLEKFNL